ncbi:MAG: hypothetical protein AB7U51_09635 [Arcobacter sp.]|uniref:hypothetical protein n=1 Tax=Arcobacter sp. TaxID=1872629 RepID=UPI003D02383C
MNLNADSFEENCLVCHKNNKQFQTFMSKYILKYSSEKRVKQAMFEFLKEPNIDNSIMPRGFTMRWGLKEKTTLSDDELMEALDIYYERFNLKKVFK